MREKCAWERKHLFDTNTRRGGGVNGRARLTTNARAVSGGRKMRFTRAFVCEKEKENNEFQKRGRERERASGRKETAFGGGGEWDGGENVRSETVFFFLCISMTSRYVSTDGEWKSFGGGGVRMSTRVRWQLRTPPPAPCAYFGGVFSLHCYRSVLGHTRVRWWLKFFSHFFYHPVKKRFRCTRAIWPKSKILTRNYYKKKKNQSCVRINKAGHDD